MRTVRQLRLSVAALLAFRLRTALAVSSVAVGVAAVLLTGAIGDGARREIVGRMEAMGTNLLVVRPAQVPRSVARPAIRGLVTTLAPDDAVVLRALPLVLEAAPVAEFASRVQAGDLAALATVRGTSPSYLVVRRLRVESGRFLDPSDERDGRRVAVLGARVARVLFPGRTPLHSELRIRGVPFEVVGVLPQRGVLADGSDEDNQVLVPLRTAMRRLLNTTWLNGILVSARGDELMPAAAEDIRRALRLRHRTDVAGGADDFEVQDTTRYVDMQRRTAASVERLGIGLGGVALVMGGTGILALTLLSVRERTPEIGLRVAVGATRADVFLQFLLEAILLALGGWILGAAGGVAGAAAVSAVTSWPVVVPVSSAAGSLVMALATGVGAGALPARRAVRIQPIDALLAS